MSTYTGKHATRSPWDMFLEVRFYESRIPGRHRAPEHADLTIEQITEQENPAK